MTSYSTSLEARLRLVKRLANWLIYGSAILGAALLAQLYTLVPSWLFYTVAAGWIFYFVVAYAAARGRENAYPAALVLSVLTLLVSLTQSEHYSLFEEGFTLASSTFLVGSVLQIGVIVYVPSYLFLKKRDS